MTEEPEEDDDEGRIEGDVLIAAFKSLLAAIGDPGVKFAIWVGDPKLEHMNLHQWDYPEVGIRIFMLSAKSEEQEEGAGHA